MFGLLKFNNFVHLVTNIEEPFICRTIYVLYCCKDRARIVLPLGNWARMFACKNRAIEFLPLRNRARLFAWNPASMFTFRELG